MRPTITTVNQGRWRMVYNWLDNTRNRLFPAQCRLCLAPGTQGQDLCEGCRAELPWLGSTCRTCALPLGGMLIDQCTRCLNAPPALDACHALFAYRSPIDDWIHALKFRQDLSVARLLGNMLSEHASIVSRSDRPRVLPIPLHPRRLAQRGYNQAKELARPLLKAGYLATRCDCRRVRHTEAQSTLDRKQRNRNLRGIFSVTASLENQQLLLVDDVMTTGATLNELAAELKHVGASRVEAIVVARTLTLI
jgi:ComF family protein